MLSRLRCPRATRRWKKPHPLDSRWPERGRLDTCGNALGIVATRGRIGGCNEENRALPCRLGGVTLASSANASKCKAITDAAQRLACYDKADSAPAPSGKTKAVNLFDAAPSNAILAKPVAKFLTPIESGPRWWIQADGGIYGFAKNSPIIAAVAPPASTGPIKVPTSPGFIGLTTVSTVANPVATGAPAVFGGGGNLRMGYWLDPARTMAIDGSAFFVQGRSGSISQAPTTLRTTTAVNTTPDVFVNLFDDTTTTSVNSAAISDQLYGGDVNLRMRRPLFADLPDFDIMFGLRYAALSEKLVASVDSFSSRTFQPALGLPTSTVDFFQFLDRRWRVHSAQRLRWAAGRFQCRKTLGTLLGRERKQAGRGRHVRASIGLWFDREQYRADHVSPFGWHPTDGQLGSAAGYRNGASPFVRPVCANRP